MNHARSKPLQRSRIPRIAGPDARPQLAVVIPVYKHSVLLEEAVISALNQETEFALVIVIVNDGCPMAETHQACLDFVAAAPDRVIWGTDWPHSNNFAPGKTPNDGDLLDLLAEFAPNEEIRKKILVANPASLYGFE